MTYYSAIDLPPRVSTPRGGRMVPVFGLVENKETGERTVEQTGEHDLYSEVQQCRKSCDIRELIKRFEAGDEKAFDVVPGFYADVSEISGLTMAEVNSRIGSLREYFNSAPADVRASFDNDFNVYVKRLGIMEKKKEPAADPAAADLKGVNENGQFAE